MAPSAGGCLGTRVPFCLCCPCLLAGRTGLTPKRPDTEVSAPNADAERPGLGPPCSRGTGGSATSGRLMRSSARCALHAPGHESAGTCGQRRWAEEAAGSGALAPASGGSGRAGVVGSQRTQGMKKGRNERQQPPPKCLSCFTSLVLSRASGPLRALQGTRLSVRTPA